MSVAPERRKGKETPSGRIGLQAQATFGAYGICIHKYYIETIDVHVYLILRYTYIGPMLFRALNS